MSTLWRKIKGVEKEKSLQPVEKGGVTLEKPTVIFLTGVSTTENKPQFVGGSISHVEEMLNSFGSGLADKTEILAWSYQKKRKNMFNVMSYNLDPQYQSSALAREFANSFLLPHMADNCTFNKKGKLESGDRKPVKSVADAFNNLTLLCYSYGTVFAQEVYNAARENMNVLGYSENEAKYIMTRIHQISLGAVSRPMLEKDRYASICLVATNDRISNHKRRLWWTFNEFRAAYAKELKINQISKRSWYISAPVQKDLWEEKVNKDGEIEMRNINHLFPKWFPRASHHELPHYTTDQDESNQFAKIARFALINCVRRKKPLRPEQMIKPPMKFFGKDWFLSKECQNYQKRIAKAVSKS